ncbi:hypothetical protein LCGC14_2328440 [marine sediment metagenome]|uniref:Uncharacterized protein n=1 Tax=marine sediment metagenome TaxID=412755 RepID=A0A0F9D344_9ZZZZ
MGNIGPLKNIMTKEFIEWTEDIKKSLKECIGDLADVMLIKNGTPYTNENGCATILITLPDGIRFRESFHQEEFDKNNTIQKYYLKEIRLKNLAWSMRTHCNEVLEIAAKIIS